MTVTDNIAEIVSGKYLGILLRNKLFENIGKDRLEAALLFYDARICEYNKGEFLLKAGDSMKSFGLVLSGCVQALTDDIEGNHMIMANVTEGSSFGEALCYLSVPEPSVYIMATTDTVIMWLSAERLRGASDSAMKSGIGDSILSDTLRNNYMALLSIRTLQMNRRIQILSKLTIREKIMMFLSEIYWLDGHDDETTLPDSGDNGNLWPVHSKIITVPMNREDMAAYIGTNRSALSRELSAMKAEGIIDYHKNEFVIL